MKDILLNFGLPEEFAKHSKALDLNKVEVAEPSKKTWEQYLYGVYDNILLTGRNGSGKTYTGCAIIVAAIMRQFLSYRVTFNNVIRQYTENDWEMPDKFTQPAYLFVDEVGKEVQKDLGQNVLEELVRTRLESKHKRTLLATNMNPAAFFQKYGPTIKSDIKGHYALVVMPDVDRRAKNG